MPSLLPLPSSVHDFIAILTTYIIPASLDLLTSNLRTMAEDGPALSTAAGQSVDSSSKGSRQPWSDAEITTLIFYLYEHRDKMSGGGFKDVVWTGLAKELLDKHHMIWSSSSMKTKFSEVRNFL
jgi:hypothetical protein